MNKRTLDNTKLGLFVIIGLVFLVTSLYLIGSNRNIFGRTISINATFYNVNGLMAGNNVRFSGIDVGTVRRVEIKSDTIIVVTMLIKKDVRQFIRKNAIATVGTDGLMGNKLVNITPIPGNADMIEEGDVLITRKAVETDLMLRTLEQTNKNLEEITSDIVKITQKVINSKSVWTIVSDTVLAYDLQKSIENIRKSTEHTIGITRNLNELIKEAKDGKGITSYLIGDTLAPVEINEGIRHLNEVSKQAKEISTELEELLNNIKKGEGAIGTALYDSTLRKNLLKSMENIEKGSDNFNENMEALKHNFLFRRYFKKQEKNKEQ